MENTRDQIHYFHFGRKVGQFPIDFSLFGGIGFTRMFFERLLNLLAKKVLYHTKPVGL